MPAHPPSLTLVAALADNRVIGSNNRLPWHLPADLQHFKRLTLGKPMLMGRRTWESLPGLLPGRRHLVLSRDPDYQAEGAEVVMSLQQALRMVASAPELMVIGGAQLYRQLLPLAERLHLTRVHASPEGDTLFPEFDENAWVELSREHHAADQRNPLPYTFIDYRRRSAHSQPSCMPH